jgi:Domain of unknown function (DUF4878)
MFKKLFLIAFIFVSFWSCREKKTLPDSDIDAARTFIKSIQDNNFSEAESFILADQENKAALSKLKKDAGSKSTAELEKYKNADIIIDELEPVNDSVTIVNYAISSNKAQKNKLKLIKRNGQWLIDLKYTFSGNL